MSADFLSRMFFEKADLRDRGSGRLLFLRVSCSDKRRPNLRIAAAATSVVAFFIFGLHLFSAQNPRCLL